MNDSCKIFLTIIQKWFFFSTWVLHFYEIELKNKFIQSEKNYTTG